MSTLSKFSFAGKVVAQVRQLNSDKIKSRFIVLATYFVLGLVRSIDWVPSVKYDVIVGLFKFDWLCHLSVVFKLLHTKIFKCLTFYATTKHNGQTHSNNSSRTTDELFECV